MGDIAMAKENISIMTQNVNISKGWYGGLQFGNVYTCNGLF